MQHLAADLMGPFPSGHSILVVVDYYSRFYEYEILRSTAIDKVIDAMEEMFSRHGLPLTIKTDNGPQFKAAEFNAYWGGGEAKSIHGEADKDCPGRRSQLEERIAKVRYEVQRTSSDNHREKPSRANVQPSHQGETTRPQHGLS